MNNNKIIAVRVSDFDMVRSDRPYAVCLDIFDLEDNFLESGTDWSYFSTEKEAMKFIKEYNDER
tara:strand:+ start:662 stop:853 length:192 start_codon:yes stop_codon:yes gene_type:complete